MGTWTDNMDLLSSKQNQEQHSYIIHPTIIASPATMGFFSKDDPGKNEGTVVMVDAVAVDPTPPTTMTTYDPEAGAVVVANANLHIVYGHLGRHGQRIQCPFCQQLITTRTRHRSDGMTIIFVIVLLILCWPLFWLPFCIPKCRAVHHTCPKCKNKVGVTEPCS